MSDDEESIHVLEPQVLCEMGNNNSSDLELLNLDNKSETPGTPKEECQEESKSFDLQFEIVRQQEFLRRIESTLDEDPEQKPQKEIDIQLIRNKIRKLKLRLSQRNRLSVENQLQREQRLAILRNNQRKRLANETPEQRQKRLENMRKYSLQRSASKQKKSDLRERSESLEF